MEQTVLESLAKNGIFALLLGVVAYVLWKEIRRISEKAEQREERIHNEAREREDRLMTLTESLTERFETLARQYEGLALDVHEIKATLKE